MTDEEQLQPKFRVQAISEIPENADISAVMVLAFNDDDQLLAVRNKRGWDIPGGHIEADETAEHALHREVFEEAYATIEDPILFMSATAQKTMLFYAARVKDLLPFKAEHETDQRRFMRPDELLSVYGGGEPELAAQVIASGINVYKSHLHNRSIA